MKQTKRNFKTDSLNRDKSPSSLSLRILQSKNHALDSKNSNRFKSIIQKKILKRKKLKDNLKKRSSVKSVRFNLKQSKAKKLKKQDIKKPKSILIKKLIESKLDDIKEIKVKSQIDKLNEIDNKSIVNLEKSITNESLTNQINNEDTLNLRKEKKRKKRKRKKEIEKTSESSSLEFFKLNNQQKSKIKDYNFNKSRLKLFKNLSLNKLKSETKLHKSLDKEKSKSQRECRICLQPVENDQNTIYKSCACTGSQAYVHKNCLEEWIRVRGLIKCDICKKEYTGLDLIKKHKSILNWLFSDPLIFGYLFAGLLITLFCFYILLIAYLEYRTSKNLVFNLFRIILLILIIIYTILFSIILINCLIKSTITYLEWRKDNYTVTIGQQLINTPINNQLLDQSIIDQQSINLPKQHLSKIINLELKSKSSKLNATRQLPKNSFIQSIMI